MPTENNKEVTKKREVRQIVATTISGNFLRVC